MTEGTSKKTKVKSTDADDEEGGNAGPAGYFNVAEVKAQARAGVALPPRGAKAVAEQVTKQFAEEQLRKAAEKKALALETAARIPKFTSIYITNTSPAPGEYGFTSTKNIPVKDGAPKEKANSDLLTLKNLGYGTNNSALPYNPAYPKSSAKSMNSWNSTIMSSLYMDQVTVDILLLIKTYGPDLTNTNFKDICLTLGISQQTIREMTDSMMFKGYFATA